MFALFQSYEFKMNLGMGYAANMMDILDINDTNSLMQASIQVFPIQACSMQIFRDPMLVAIVAGTLEPLLEEFIDQPE